MRRRRLQIIRMAWVSVATPVLALSLAEAVPADAEPETPVRYPAGASATLATGKGFDTCTAPSISALRHWRSSPYRTINVYFGGSNRACNQPNLDPEWVHDAAATGWWLLPTYVGRQPPCVHNDRTSRFNASNAASYGASDATDAAAKAEALGMLPGSALYADIEHYDRSNSSCTTAVQRYVSAWVKTLHSSGYLAGVYVHQNSGLADLSSVYSSSSYARPDAVWVARWDGKTTLHGWPTAPNRQWAVHQRAKQYRGDHSEKWSGVRIRIDSNSLDAPVATVAHSYRVTSRAGLNARRGPSTSHELIRTHRSGGTLPVVCQAAGQKVAGTRVWNLLADGSWVSDYYVSTPSDTTFSPPLQRCAFPGQVTASTSLRARTGPGTSHAVSGSSLPSGALAWVSCQATGTTVGSSRIWNRLTDGRWVSDYYVSNRSSKRWSAPVPRCP